MQTSLRNFENMAWLIEQEKPTKIIDLKVEDVRFPTSLTLVGSDASHPAPDYSAVYVTLVTDSQKYNGYGLSFTAGRGNEIVKYCVDALRFLVIDGDISGNFSVFCVDSVIFVNFAIL